MTKTEAGAGQRPNLSRAEAARWFADQGITHIGVEYLEKAAARGQGPEQFRVGKYVYYSRAALEAWLSAEMERGRSQRGGADPVAALDPAPQR